MVFFCSSHVTSLNLLNILEHLRTEIPAGHRKSLQNLKAEDFALMFICHFIAFLGLNYIICKMASVRAPVTVKSNEATSDEI